MVTTLVIGGLVVYVIGSYYFIGRDLWRSPGPAGLGVLAIPFAPLLLPLGIAYGIKEGISHLIYKLRR